MNKTFCPLPWKEIASSPYGSIRLCCTSVSSMNLSKFEDGTTANLAKDLHKGWNTDLFVDARTKMKAGQPVAACSTCYQQEKSGIKSPRQSWLEKYHDMPIESLPTTVDLGQVAQLDLRMGNLCNLRCRMCNPFSSSAWAHDWKKMGDLVEQPDEETWDHLRKNSWYENPKVWEQLKALVPSLQSIYLTGGEPMLVEPNKEFIKYCIETGHASHIELRYNTNGTIWDAETTELWKNFERIILSVSIDAVGSLNDYIRHPSQWSKIQSNLEKYIEAAKSAPILISIACTVQAYNIFHLADFIDFFKAKNLPIFLNILQQPSFLSISVLDPDKSKVAHDSLLRHSDYPGVTGILGMLNSARNSEWDQFASYTKKLDQLRGQNISDFVGALGI